MTISHNPVSHKNHMCAQPLKKAVTKSRAEQCSGVKPTPTLTPTPSPYPSSEASSSTSGQSIGTCNHTASQSQSQHQPHAKPKHHPSPTTAKSLGTDTAI